MVESQEILDALESVHVATERPVATAPEIAERLDVGRRRVLQILDALEAVEAVGSVQIGRGRAFWSREAVSIAGLPPAAAPADPSAEAPADPPAEAVQELEDVVAELELPGSGTILEERQEAVLAVLAYLRREGRARAGDFQEDVYPDHAAGYSTARSWWKNCMSSVLTQLREQEVVVLVDRHDGVYELSESV